MTSDSNQLLTPRQAAELLAVTVGTLTAWRTRGVPALPYVRIGKRVVRYRPADIEEFVDAHHEAKP